jgi:hypothetical protein
MTMLVTTLLMRVALESAQAAILIAAGLLKQLV